MSNEPLTLESLGMSKEEITKRVVDRLCVRFLRESKFNCDRDEDDENDEESCGTTPMDREVDKKITELVDVRIKELIQQKLIPHVERRIADVILQKTNCWGEEKGSPITFVEYIIAQADCFLLEPVNDCGKTRKEDDRYWRQAGPRINYLVDTNLNDLIKKAAGDMVNLVSRNLSVGLAEAAKAHIRSFAENIRLSISSKPD